ncbi:MAG: GNAT family N-acetyltransferase [Proteobacteria bacterium]|nr:GNAT family N-acetyltransferase [Pseudomonadota bacterium]
MNLNDAGAQAATVCVHRTIRDIPRDEWDACFAGDPEGWDYYAAIEASGFADFSFVYLAVRERDRVVAVAPAFITRYNLDTTVQGVLKAALRPFARLLTLRLLCLGSPYADQCHLGFAPGLPDARRGELAALLLGALDGFAAAQGIGLVAAKDMAEPGLTPEVRAAFEAAGYSRQPSLPNAVLALPAGGEDGYLKSLSHAARRDVRRKLKALGRVRIEERRGDAALALVPQMMRLYEAQRGRSPVDFDQFETLTPDYFRAVLARPDGRAVAFLYWHADELIAFNLCYHTDRVFIDKFIGFELPLARTLNLYVVSWINNVRYCIGRGIPLLQSGQTAYAMKLHLGSHLLANWIYFRHRNPVVNLALRLAGPLLAADAHDPDLGHPHGGHA